MMHAGEVPGPHELLEWIPDAVVVTDNGGKIVYANRQVEGLTGYTRRELVGRRIEVLVPAGLRTNNHARNRRGIARLMSALDDDFRLKRKDGSIVPVEISLGPAGADTIAVMRECGATALAVDAGRTLLLDRSDMIAKADTCGICMAGYPPLG